MNSNPFVLDLKPAFTLFCQAAADGYRQQLDEDTLKALLEQQNDTLDQQWSVLTDLASRGEEIATPLDGLLQEWARKKGYQVILENFGMALDQNDVQIIQERFGDALWRKQQSLSSELRAILLRGREDREQAERERSERILPHAARMLADQHDQASSWYQEAGRVLHEREVAIWEGQAIAHEWAFRAQDSMDKQQAGLDSQYRFVESIHGNVNEMLQPAYQQELAYQAADSYRSQQRASRMGCILGILAVATGVISFGVWLMFHIV